MGYKDRSRRLAREQYWENHERSTYKCPDCGRTEDELVRSFEVHHKHGEPMDNRLANLVALCRPCHNLREGKKPTLEEIRNLRSGFTEETGQDECVQAGSVDTVYAAGAMHYANEEDSTWRSNLKLPNTTAEVLNPKEVTYDHGADLVAGVAGKDLQMVQQADAVVAYFDKDEQVGTLVELMYAVSERKPALVLFHEDYMDGPLVSQFRDSTKRQKKIECAATMRYESRIYWFLLNTLLGDTEGWIDGTDWGGVDSPVEVRVVDGESGITEAFHDWQSEWVGHQGSRHLQGHSHRDAARESFDLD